MTDTAHRLFDLSAVPETLSLAERFAVPPFSVIDARGGWWTQRKRVWRSLGLMPAQDDDDELRRRGVRTFANGERSDDLSKKLWQMQDASGGWSTFDPVLCEWAYRWFSPVGGWVYDPFAGSPTSGIVASVTQRNFLGCELSEDQVDRNYRHADRLIAEGILNPEYEPVWMQGDSAEFRPSNPVDFVWSCPPYADLVRYSDDPSDLSTMGYPEFLEAYERILANATAPLRDDRFCGLVVAEVRDGKGRYRGFLSDTVRIMERCGLNYYNECVQLLPVSSAAMRAARQFMASRKLCRIHQTVLLFVKGDPKRATEFVSDQATDAAAMRAAGDVETPEDAE